MRLLYYTSDNELRRTEDLRSDDEVPPYAILSHTWQDGQEVEFDDLTSNAAKSKTGYKKIIFCADQAKRDGLRHFWVDTCCIQKSDPIEHQTAINSMFRWYQNARQCYVYLSDVSLRKRKAFDGPTWEPAFQTSRWFTRGWTLQELLAPRSVKFYTLEGELIGHKNLLQQEIHQITGIPVPALEGATLQDFSVEERMSWANRRQTTYEEDKVYCLLGIFGVFLVPNYGEGEEYAFRRLRRELRSSPDLETANVDPTGNVHWMVPRTVNSLFTGRVELIDRIQDALRNDQCQVDSEQKRLVITGIGGMGKSEVCLKIANLMREDFWGIFWVDVGNQSTAKSGFTAIAKALESVNESIEESLQALASTKKPWLLILDNADDPKFDYSQYLPSGNRGVVIITSRIPQCSRYSTLPTEALDGLDLKHSTDLLLKAARVPEESWVIYDQQAQDIVNLLGSHTLALVQAGAYIAEGYCGLDQYPEKYHRQRKRLLKYHVEQEQSRYRDVYATFEASADVLKSSDPEAGQDALDLLAILSVLHFSVLPLQVFADAWRGAKWALQSKDEYVVNWGVPGPWHFAQLPDFIGGQDDEWDDYRLNRATSLLTSLSLVTRHSSSNDEGLYMHPLAHAWAKDRLQAEQQMHAWVNAGCMLALSRKHPEEWQTYDEELRPHMQSFLSLSVGTVLLFGPQKEILTIVEKCGWILDTMREDILLEGLLKGIYHTLQILPSDPSQEHLQIWDLAAKNMLNTRNIRKAVALLEHIVDIRKVTQLEAHPSLLVSQHELASAYLLNGQANEAVVLLEHVLYMHKITVPESHPHLLASQHTLAYAYKESGQTDEAVILLEHVLKIRETTLPETHPHRLASENRLGCAYLDSGQIYKALILLEHVVKVRKTTLLETHPSRLASEHELGRAYWKDGQVQKALTLLEHVVKVQKTTLPETHPHRLVSEHALGSAYMASGQIYKALALLEPVVEAQKTTLPETHPDRLSSEHELGCAYWKDGQVQKALTLLEHVVKICKTTLAKDHPHRLASEESLLYMQDVLNRETA